MHVQCGTCDARIPIKAKMPLRIFQEGDKQVVATDYSAVYEHVRDAHPDQWTAELAAEFNKGSTSD